MYSSIAEITITGSATSATGDAVTLSTDGSGAVIVGSVYTASYSITASYALNSSNTTPSVSTSYAVTASYALNGGGTGGTQLGTGSTYPFTSSWAVNWDSSSVITLIGTKQNAIGTGSLYPITASWAISASYAPGSPSVSASYATTASYALNGGTGGNQLGTGSTYPFTSSWANNLAITSSNNTTGSYTLVAGDYGKVLTFQNATTNSIVIPSGLPTNFNCFLVNTQTGSVRVTGSGGIQLNNSLNCYKLTGQYSAASIIGYLPDKYILSGDVSL